MDVIKRRWRVGMVTVLGVALIGGVLAAVSVAGAQQKRFKLAGVAAILVDPYFISLKCGAQAEAKRLGADFTWQGPTTADVRAQLSTFNSIAVRNPDGVVLAPFSTTAFIAPVRKLMRGGIPVIVADGNLDKPVEYQQIHTTYKEVGEIFVKALVGLIGREGKLGIIAFGPGNTVDAQRYREALRIMKAKYPNIEVLPIQYGQADTAKTAAIAAAMIRANSDLTAIYATNGPQGEGVASALLGARQRGKIKLIAFDATPGEVRGLKSGAFQGLIAQSPYLEGVLSVRSLVNYLRKHGAKAGPVKQAKPFFVPTPVKFLTPQNVNTPAAQPFLYKAAC